MPLLRLVLSAVFMIAGLIPKSEFVVVRGEKVRVQANTSIGSINCTYSSAGKRDTLFLNKAILKQDRLSIAIPVKKFSCGNILLNKDFQHTLNAQNHPFVQVDVLELNKHKNTITGTLLLMLAGKSKVLKDVSFYVITNSKAQTLATDLCLSFTDFELATPKKMGGMVKVDDDLQISVELQLCAE
ncbi:YceI family protein [Pontibacter harenae]|uniref:YceI family protein n=1 Tax=Pontibacter harenae TaxID=2894083 RepID=UPI001E5B91DF|nr:YceI family protein [Pontibacter harenae]MCC9165835.1 hypothetical protein [Pontibacter harenae]